MVIQLLNRLNWNILVGFRSIFGLIWMGFGYKIWPSKVIWLIWLGRFGNRMLTPICLLKMTLIETIKLIYTNYEFIPFDIFFFFFYPRRGSLFSVHFIGSRTGTFVKLYFLAIFWSLFMTILYCSLVTIIFLRICAIFCG